MRIEQENMNLVMAPFLCSMFSFARNERVDNNWLDYFVLASFLLTRTMVLLGFLFHLQFDSNRSHRSRWVLFYAFTGFVYMVGLGTFWAFQNDIEEHKHLAIRRVTVYTEMFSIPLLLLWQFFIF
jgi:hypothetical protein